jgi:hypothetical protein
MGDESKERVFLSHRRTNIAWALAFQNLLQHGYDVFIDYVGIAGGAFERVILGNLTSRAHFILLIPPALDVAATRPTGCAARSKRLWIAPQLQVTI